MMHEEQWFGRLAVDWVKLQLTCNHHLRWARFNQRYRPTLVRQHLHFPKSCFLQRPAGRAVASHKPGQWICSQAISSASWSNFWREERNCAWHDECWAVPLAFSRVSMVVWGKFYLITSKIQEPLAVSHANSPLLSAASLFSSVSPSLSFDYLHLFEWLWCGENTVPLSKTMLRARISIAIDERMVSPMLGLFAPA